MDGQREQRDLAETLQPSLYILELLPLARKIEHCADLQKGGPTNVENYRPVSFLQISSKVLAAATKSRLHIGLGNWINRTQYGFRPNRPRSHAIFVARRLLDLSERLGNKLTMILLEWARHSIS
jgi:hypothetical protein